MLLGFKEQIKGVDTGFVGKILLCPNLKNGRDYDSTFQIACDEAARMSKAPKIHTIRNVIDPKRWPVGRGIQYAVGVRTKQCRIFAEGVCTGTQDIVFRIRAERLLVAVGNKETMRWNMLNSDDERLTLAINDGFDTWEAFDAWFRPLVVAEGNRLDRKLIHWTDLRY